ncbi:hypothetical protein FRAHR75_1620003 [Frankia sp. Hr75.2]|nr:hypothetical protein FRAHR75_1620003 [Frankia sp. Hr75.2]
MLDAGRTRDFAAATRLGTGVLATGSQGGGLARAILADAGREFAARGLTRSATSDKARELAAQVTEIIEADMRDEGPAQGI